MKLDVGGGKRSNNGWVTMDLHPESNIIHDLDIIPWPLPDNCCDELRCWHTLEHFSSALKAMEEAFRIAKNGAVFHIIVPWWKSAMFEAPEHKDNFKPKWFNKLSRDSWSEAMQHMCKVNWKVMKGRKIRGKYNKLRIYGYEVWLKAIKK